VDFATDISELDTSIKRIRDATSDIAKIFQSIKR